MSGMVGFIQGYALALKTCFQRATALILALRRDDPASVEVQGLTNVKERSLEARIKGLVDVSGIQDYPSIARRWETLQVALDANPRTAKRTPQKDD